MRSHHSIATLYLTDGTESGNVAHLNYIPHIYPNGMHFGRSLVKQCLGVDDASVSLHHLEFSCVVYEDIDDDSTAPIVPARLCVRHLGRNPSWIRRKSVNGASVKVPLSRTNESVILEEDDLIFVSPRVHIRCRALQRGLDANLTEMNMMQEALSFGDRYTLSPRRLGTGACGSVFVANEVSLQRQLACKVLSIVPKSFSATSNTLKHSDRASKIYQLVQECKVLRGISHPNIIRLEKVFCTESFIYMFQEAVTAGDLFSYVERNNGLSESQTIPIVYQIAKAVEHLHLHKIVHRDLKPENVLMASSRDGARVVVTDFGQARKLAPDSRLRGGWCRMKSPAGTDGHRAPEMHPSPAWSGYTNAVDIWSIGSIVVFCLQQDRFNTMSDSNVIATAADIAIEKSTSYTANIDFDPDWASLTSEARSFVKGCLHPFEEVRMTATQALSHAWLSHKVFREELQKMYERAISNWKPCENDPKDLIEEVETGLLTNDSLHTWQQQFSRNPSIPYITDR